MHKATSTHFALAAAGLFVTLHSPNAQAQCVSTESGASMACHTLFAGQTIDAGSVCFEVVGDNLDVTYITTGGWELEEAHLWVGSYIVDMPQTRKGNPIPGQFPHASGDITGETSHTFNVPLVELGYGCPGDDAAYLAAAHAAVRLDDGEGGYQSETGWSDGSPIESKGGWATFSTVNLSCACDGGEGGGGGQCETAFGFDSSYGLCFLDIDEDGDNQGDFSVAPGQYPVVDEDLGDVAGYTSTEINGLSGDVYFVAHATVCGF